MWILPVSLREGLENQNDEESGEGSACEADIKTTVYKNAGAIQNLQESVEKLMKQVNQVVLTNDKQTAQIQNISELETKYDKVASQADELAKANKSRLLELAKQAHKKAQMAQSEANKIPSP
jgi:uncharacterized coiled-coil DUF342 family protein